MTKLISVLSLCTALAAASLAHAANDIGMQRAGELALKRVAGDIVSIERETERGKEVFEVEIRTPAGAKWEVLVDAYDGTILEAEQDD